MGQHALRELDAIGDPEAAPFEYHRLRGEACRMLEDYDRALAAFAKALVASPDDLDVLMGMAWCYKRSDRLPRAIAAMEEAYRSHPKEPIVLYNIACYYSLAGDKTQALSWLGRALRMKSALRSLIADESDFDPLRDDPDFQYVTGAEHLSDR
jgi:tetratricopeptide (TPR) repeat protein